MSQVAEQHTPPRTRKPRRDLPAIYRVEPYTVDDVNAGMRVVGPGNVAFHIPYGQYGNGNVTTELAWRLADWMSAAYRAGAVGAPQPELVPQG